MDRYFITAIGTDSGKTLVSAILCEALQADYWKPVQSGYPRDLETVQSLVSDKRNLHEEQYLLNTPASPHAAAEIDGVQIVMDAFVLPTQEKPLVVEGAGGLMVPLNRKDLMIDLISKLSLPVVLVSNLYLGNINHTLLSAKALQDYGIPVKGIIFNGARNEASEEIILEKTGYQVLLRLPKLEQVNRQIVVKYAQEIKDRL